MGWESFNIRDKAVGSRLKEKKRRDEETKRLRSNATKFRKAESEQGKWILR
jgi:hypothetical protein